MYEIVTIGNKNEIERGNKANINIYNWSDKNDKQDYRPNAFGVLCLLKNEGLFLHMECEETNPLATYTAQNEWVCQDSCLEFFTIPTPAKSQTSYLNFECNANGSLLCAFGDKIYPRKTITELGLDHPKAIPFKTQNSWGYELLIEFDLLSKLYNQEISYQKGDIITGNFFKCGDKTQNPHFGSYTKIDSATPNFHQIQFFEKFIFV
ncbi:MAG: carbohydrate-binding family 9-like protein [Oscillospiraceae bacterium]